MGAMGIVPKAIKRGGEVSADPGGIGDNAGNNSDSDVVFRME